MECTAAIQRSAPAQRICACCEHPRITAPRCPSPAYNGLSPCTLGVVSVFVSSRVHRYRHCRSHGRCIATGLADSGAAPSAKQLVASSGVPTVHDCPGAEVGLRSGSGPASRGYRAAADAGRRPPPMKARDADSTAARGGPCDGLRRLAAYISSVVLVFIP